MWVLAMVNVQIFVIFVILICYNPVLIDQEKCIIHCTVAPTVTAGYEFMVLLPWNLLYQHIWSAAMPATIPHEATHSKLQVTGTHTMAVRINCCEARHCRNLVSHTRLHTQSHFHPHLRSHRHIVLLTEGSEVPQQTERHSEAGVRPAIWFRNHKVSSTAQCVEHGAASWKSSFTSS